MSDDYERVILVKPEIYMYRIPPRTTNRAYKAAEWKLDSPDWTGRLRIVAKGVTVTIKLEDKISGELFAACPVDNYPGTAVESVSDSARYFVLRIKDESSRVAYIGMGFFDRSDSFDFNVALQDHFKQAKKEEAGGDLTIENEKKLDLKFKEGQTFTLNIGKKNDGAPCASKPKPKTTLGGGLGLLPPPPAASSRIQPPPSIPRNISSENQFQPALQAAEPKSNFDFLIDIGLDSNSSNSNQTSAPTNASNNWVQF